MRTIAEGVGYGALMVAVLSLLLYLVSLVPG